MGELFEKDIPPVSMRNIPRNVPFLWTKFRYYFVDF